MAGFQQVLITGADGYLGARIAEEYLRRTARKLILWVRADGEEEFENKRKKLLARFGKQVERIVFASGNLTSAHPFEGLDPTGVTTIIHCAAVTKFNVDEETAQAVNVSGAGKTMDFALRCPQLESFNLLSTIYASGLKEGLIKEAPLSGGLKFGNHYEKSKWESEDLLLRKYQSLPWRILRVATVISDDESGNVTQQNAFHNTLKLFYYGLLSILPGRPETPLYFVTGEFCSKAIFELIAVSPSKAVYHVSPNRDGLVSVDQLIGTAFDVFLCSEDFRKRRILKPIYSDRQAFETLAQGISSLNAGILSQSISSIAPFSSQLFLNKSVENHHLCTALKNETPFNMTPIVKKTCEYLVRTKWNKG